MDLTCLKLCSGESEIHLTRTISRALGCRYQPAQLNVPAMLKQLEEAKVAYFALMFIDEL